MSLDTPNETQVVEAGTLPRWVTVLFVVAFALVAYLLYGSYASGKPCTRVRMTRRKNRRQRPRNSTRQIRGLPT